MKKMVPSDLPISDAVTAVKEQNDYAAKNDSLICGEYHGEKLTYVDIHRLCVSCAFKTPQSVPSVFVPGVKGQILTESLFGCEREAYRKIKRLSIIYKMEHNLIDIPLDHYIQHNTRSSRKHDSQFLQIRYSANIFGNSL